MLQEAPACFVSICELVLLRDCLAHCLVKARVAASVEGYGTIDDWRPGFESILIVMLLYYRGEAAENITKDIPKILRRTSQARIVVISDHETPELIASTIALGAHAFVGTVSSLDLVLAALQLVRAGGKYVSLESFRGKQVCQ
ncbi:hypothetical protein AB4037_34015 [Labrys sp. KB_33_2]|uniref:hypothetical protein n=1 Tax=Labrys sp. KB_33_2 TaxID=3237479 RepID=UPI003F908715